MEVSEESGVADVLENEAEVESEDPVENGLSALSHQTDDIELDNYEDHSSQSSPRDHTLSQTEKEFQPTVLIHRFRDERIQSPKEKALNNGLDPIGIELISSSDMNTSKAGSEFSDKSDDTQDYLHSTNESPRRNRKNKETPKLDPDEGLEPEDMEIEREIEIMHYSPAGEDAPAEEKGSPMSEDASAAADSDSTLPMPSMDPPESKRMAKLHARARAKSLGVFRGRKKSIGQQMKDELSVTSDKEEPHEDEEDQTSEVSYITNHSLELKAVNPPPKPGWDSFCFKCHSDSMVLSLTCAKCKCSYHRQCVRPNPIPKNVEEFVCPECFEVEAAEASPKNKYGHDKIDPNTLADMLTIILEKIRTYPDRELFENDIVVKGVKEPTESLIVSQMSLKTLESRIKSRHYKVTEAFIHDIKQLEHNWNIVDKARSKTLKTILKYVTTEINELEACVYCYEKSFITGDWFVLPCKRPHLLIWAKLKGYPFWPAKVMSIDARQQVDVRFFGAHDRAWVPAIHCMLFSEQDPNKTKGSTPTNNKSTSKTQKGIADAMKEKDDYIKNLREKYGFKYFKFREHFDPNDIQKQLDQMLPGLKNHKEVRESHSAVDKEFEGQKEKLTLKIIKGQSSNYQVEQKQTEKTPRPNLYKVLSKNDENADNEQPAKLSLIIKRKSNVEQETDKPKRMKANDSASETSESNASVQSFTKVPKVPVQKHRKMKSIDKEQKIPELVAIKKPKVQKHKSLDETEISKRRQTRGSRFKSLLPDSDKPLLVPVAIPPGTTEIQLLREVSESPVPAAAKATAVKQRSRSLIRSRSTEKEAKKEVKHVRRVSSPQRPPLKRSLSESIKKAPSRRESMSKVETPPAAVDAPVEPVFDPTLVIKDEPMSEGEEVLTLSDIPKLMQEKGGKKKKLIVISTTDGDTESPSPQQQLAAARAKKSFLNKIQIPASMSAQQQAQSSQQQTSRNSGWMISIPTPTTSAVQSPPTSNRSTPASDSQSSIVQHKSSNVSSARATPNVAPPVFPQVTASTRVPPVNNINSTQNSLHMNGQHPSSYLPTLQPRPQGVFVNDGHSGGRDIGPVSRMFADNAYRITDYFKSVLIESVSAFAPDVPSAENLMLRSENEKLHRDMQATKADCQQKMQELRREHQDEMETLKKTYEDRMKNLQNNLEQERNRAVMEIRKQCEHEKQRAIENTRRETKKTTWCSNCTKEARFYCCWNTSYCGQQCQKTHWQNHQKYCTNKNSANEGPQPQQANKQTMNEAPVAIQPASNRTSVLRTPLQLQMQHPQGSIVPAPPVSIQQHLILPPPGVTLMSPNMMPSQIFLSKQGPIRVYQNDTLRENLPQNMILQAIPRNSDGSAINVISNVALQEGQLHQALANVNNSMNN